jgi:FAD/FMN-containing dehydrogenase
MEEVMATPTTLGRDFVERLGAAAGTARILSEPADMAPFVDDWRGRFFGRALAVVQPRETAELAAIVRLCAGAGVPVVPQGGNTGLCGGATPDPAGGSVVISLARMDRIRELDPLADTLTVDAGCVLAKVQEAADAADRLFPMSLGSEGSCQIGGNISTNAGGTTVLRYGTMRELVLGLEVVLPDGRVFDGLRTLRKNNTGYDLKQLFIGAEGTLGIITAAALKLFPKPRASATAIAAVPSVDAALRLLAILRKECGDRVTNYEIMSESEMRIVEREFPAQRSPLEARSPWYQLVELTDTLGDLDLRGALERPLARALEEGIVSDAVLAASEAQAEAIWKLRHSVSEAHKKGGVGVSHDTAVPISTLPRFVEQSAARVSARFPDVDCIYVGHIGDGNIHFIAQFRHGRFADKDAFEAAASEINKIVYDLSSELGGSISAEHGIGQTLRAKLPSYKSAVELEMMREVKRMLDPRGLMNPGKVL